MGKATANYFSVPVWQISTDCLLKWQKELEVFSKCRLWHLPPEHVTSLEFMSFTPAHSKNEKMFSIRHIQFVSEVRKFLIFFLGDSE